MRAGRAATAADLWPSVCALDSGSVPRLKLLDRDQERSLAQQIETGDAQARQRLIESNLRLVLSIARQYQGYGVPMSDLVQEGNIGLIATVDHFDWRRGTRFSTCATLWIRQSILRALPSLRHTVRIPLRLLRDSGRVDAAADSLAQQLQRRPSSVELEAKLGEFGNLVEDLRSLPLDLVSLDAADEEGRRGLAEAVADDQAGPEASTVEQIARRELLESLNRLSERERQVIALRYGLGSGTEHTLGEIGRILNLSRQRVNQIEMNALRRLRRLAEERSVEMAG